ncbi:Glycosyl hydrolases family 43 [Geosmithia morbida]|uniref:Glycosyl hydrolases family 43 n=1 Tax=Geosmithia morbida TaxID=1094350 RepID=A0A9P4YNY8_9HYPO|nr:Glycosyl hydrolases family 43 [Geosmithia morbida]KAF4119380.1 Glycosyl hydrolases family 43 [Geosmithia morbida]
MRLSIASVAAAVLAVKGVSAASSSQGSSTSVAATDGIVPKPVWPHFVSEEDDCIEMLDEDQQIQEIKKLTELTKQTLDRLHPRDMKVPRSEESSKWDGSLTKRGLMSSIPGYWADPNIVTFPDDCNYYIYATTDGGYPWSSMELYAWMSTDLVYWTRTKKPILYLNGDEGNVPWARGKAWAPTIIKANGKFYFYFSGGNIANGEKEAMGVAVGPSPLGPFKAQPEPFITGQERVSSLGTPIDPQVYHDPQSGVNYIYWGNGSPVMAEMNADMLSVNWDTATAPSGLTYYAEAPFVNFRDGIYHMTYSIGHTASEDYRVGYATSTSPTGPWTYHGLILQKDVSKDILGPGHDSIINTPGTDNWFIAYHRFRKANENGSRREIIIDQVFFKDGLIQPIVPTIAGVKPSPITGCGL